MGDKRKEFTAQFFKKNHSMFLLTLVSTLLLVGVNIVVSWMIQQIVDIITGDGGLFGLSELVKICLLLVVVTAGILLLNWYARPKFIYRATKQDLREIDADSLYELVSIVQQNVFIFNSSIRDNVTMYHDFPEERVEQAARLAGLSALVAAHGWDYDCGENGCNLSGGERQRISIARSLLKGTPVLFVDEATAALDAATAYAVTDSILKLEDLTRVVVTHRLEERLLSRYNNILVLKNGRVEESGSFGELMERKGYFYSLYTVSQ